MAIQKYVALSYCFAFLAVYLASLGYALISTNANLAYNTSLPTNAVAQNVTMAVSGMMNLAPSGWIIVGVIVIIGALILLTRAVTSMRAAI